jgi:type IV secretory pathway protease TraF
MQDHDVLNYDITCAIYFFLVVPPTVAIRKNEYLGEVGLEITMDCDVLSDPPETAVYWRRDVRGEMSDVIHVWKIVLEYCCQRVCTIQWLY